MKARSKIAAEISALVASCVVVALLAGPSLAQKPFLDRLKKSHGLEKEKNGTCKMCHVYDKEKGESPSKDNLGAFGKAVQARAEMKPILGKGDEHKFTPEELNYVEAAVKAMEKDDLDKDGATNGEELALGTFPADPKSTPSKDELEKHRKK